MAARVQDDVLKENEIKSSSVSHSQSEEPPRQPYDDIAPNDFRLPQSNNEQPCATLVRQGDVLIERVGSLPADATERSANDEARIVLAHGEVTGHSHWIPSADARLFEEGDGSAGRTFIVISNATLLRHEEHSSIALLPGVYRVIRQRLYAPGAWREMAIVE